MLQLAQVDKYYQRGSLTHKKVIDDLCLDIAEGEFVTIIGSNGAGKSTFMKLLAGEVIPERGQIFMRGRDVTRRGVHTRSKDVGRVFQDPTMGTCSDLTIEENLCLAHNRGSSFSLSWALKPKYQQLFQEKLASLGLDLEKRLQDKIGLLSGGQRQAITLLMATLRRPHVLLLDEHTAALDPKTAKVVMDLTADIVKSHAITTIMITHQMSQALAYGTRLIMLHQGRIVLDVRGEDKARLTEQDLLNFFKELD